MKENIDQLKENLIQKIMTHFPDYEIITLGYLVKNISNPPSVRGGNKKKLDYNDYYEVGLSNRNLYGVIKIDPSKKKQLGAANKEMVLKYKLKKNDLLLPYYVSKTINVARIESEYDLPMVTNTSTLRVEMYKDTPEEVSIIIQSYFSLPYVQEYLIKSAYIMNQQNTQVYRDNSFKRKRNTFKPKLLLELPIPRFHINQNINYKKIFNEYAEIKHLSIEIHGYGRKFLTSLNYPSEITAHLFNNNTDTLHDISPEEQEIKKKMQKLSKELKELYKQASKIFPHPLDV